MSREIKFRAWDDGKMIYEKDISHLSLLDNRVLRLAKFWCNIRNDSKIMQYTGLKDKNGKEIYEGDILKKSEPIDGNFVDTIYDWYIVEWRGTGFTYAPLKDRQYKQYTTSPFTDYIEIIGNIYQNPELL